MHKSLLNQAALFGLLALVAAGCSRERLKSIPVSGRVSLGGQAPQGACSVFFVPTKVPEGTPNRPSIASVSPDGAYAVKAFKDSKGLLPGTYQVLVTYAVLKPGGDPNSESGWTEKRYEAGELVVDADSRGIEHNIDVPAGANKGKS